MRCIDRLLRKNQLTDTFNPVKPRATSSQKQELTVFERYPDGLPLEVLQDIDYSKFGAMLKAERLLPPSYDRKPVKVQLGDFCGVPRVVLTFKSTTTDNKRYVGIYRYSVAYSEKINEPIAVMEVNPSMMNIWRGYVERIITLKERGCRSSLLLPTDVRISTQNKNDYMEGQM